MTSTAAPASAPPMSTLSSPTTQIQIQVKPGILSLPSSPSSLLTLQKLLTKDHESHHCFFNPIGLHNHLSHHLLAAFDLGAGEGLLQAIYESEAGGQRSI